MRRFSVPGRQIREPVREMWGQGTLRPIKVLKISAPGQSPLTVVPVTYLSLKTVRLLSCCRPVMSFMVLITVSPLTLSRDCSPLASIHPLIGRRGDLGFIVRRGRCRRVVLPLILFVRTRCWKLLLTQSNFLFRRFSNLRVKTRVR